MAYEPGHHARRTNQDSTHGVRTRTVRTAASQSPQHLDIHGVPRVAEPYLRRLKTRHHSTAAFAAYLAPRVAESPERPRHEPLHTRHPRLPPMVPFRSFRALRARRALREPLFPEALFRHQFRQHRHLRLIFQSAEIMPPIVRLIPLCPLRLLRPSPPSRRIKIIPVVALTLPRNFPPLLLLVLPLVLLGRCA
ncbi:unnamed protein product [Closterium sp. NIES-54]